MVLIDKTRKEQVKGVLKEQYITVAVKVNGIVTQRLKLRLILFKTDDGKVYIYVTNNFTLPAAQLLMVVIRKKAATKKSFANMITVIRLHLTSYVGLLDFIKDTCKAWRKTHNASFAFRT